MFRQIRSALVTLLFFTALTGFLYPALVTGIARLLFPSKAEGSLVQKEGRVVGTELIGQPFDDPRYFWGRLSATAPFPCNAAASAGSNRGQSHPELLRDAAERATKLRAADPENARSIPIDLLTASGSGLDPHITPAAAEYQVSRVARTRGITEEEVLRLVAANTDGRQLGILGEPRVNVLLLNLALDALR